MRRIREIEPQEIAVALLVVAALVVFGSAFLPSYAGGDIAAVWTWQAFVAAGIWGVSFGFLVAPRSRGARSRGEQSAVIALLLAWWISGEVASQVIAALTTGDFLWERIASRLGPYLFGAVATGFGVWIGLPREEKKP